MTWKTSSIGVDNKCLLEPNLKRNTYETVATRETGMMKEFKFYVTGDFCIMTPLSVVCGY
jgi:hypothetical protein